MSTFFIFSGKFAGTGLWSSLAAGFFQSNNQNGAISDFTILLIVLAVVLGVWGLFSWYAKQPLEYPFEGHDLEAHEIVEQVSAAARDKLELIEGIGPKIASIFHSAGITTFSQLAEMEVKHLEQILKEAGIRLGDPTTWPEQAKLAALGDWHALEALQSTLKGGRRT